MRRHKPLMFGQQKGHRSPDHAQSVERVTGACPNRGAQLATLAGGHRHKRVCGNKALGPEQPGQSPLDDQLSMLRIADKKELFLSTNNFYPSVICIFFKNNYIMTVDI